MIIDMHEKEVESPTEKTTKNFEKVIIPVESVAIPETKETVAPDSIKEILSDMEKPGETDPSVPENSELETATMINEDDCMALLHTVYGLMAFLVKGEVPNDQIIAWRGKQMYIIMARYHLQVKYLDLAFFGLGIASDFMIIYQSRHKQEETKKEKEVEKAYEQNRMET